MRIGRAACDALARATAAVPRRFVLVTPAARTELPALKEAGFTGYLVKPVRAASLAARMAGGDGEFERPGDSVGRRRSTPRPTDTAKGLAILVAEDNEINALLARSLLTRLGHRPTIATNGDAAVDAWLSARAAGEPYAIVLMDVHMPGSDGIEATRRIREAEAGGAAHADRRAHRQCVRGGPRRLHRRRHGRLPDQAARPRAAGDGAGDRRRGQGDGGVAATVPPNPHFHCVGLIVRCRFSNANWWRNDNDRNATAEDSSVARLPGHHGDVPILLEGRQAAVRHHLVRLRARIGEPGGAGLAGLFRGRPCSRPGRNPCISIRRPG